MDERMTLEQVRDWLIKEGQFRIGVRGKNEHDSNLLKMADAITARLTQPAQAVDVGAIQRVINSIDLRAESRLDMQCKGWVETLTRAIGNAQAEGSGHAN